MFRFSRLPAVAVILVTALTLSACGGRHFAPVTSRGEASGATTTATAPLAAEQLEQTGQYSLAARDYLRQAETAATPQREHLMLKGLSALVKAQQLDQVMALLPTVHVAGLDPVLSLRKTLIEAQIALGERRYEDALRLVTPMMEQTNLDPSLHADIYQVHAQASLAMHDQFGAVTSLIRRERYLVDRGAIDRNQQDLWAILESSPPDSLRARRDQTADPVLRGWLDLALTSIEAGANPYRLSAEVEQWRRRYPAHPASATLLFALAAPVLQPGTGQPDRIALLLPLSSRFGDAAQAFRDGFMAVHNADTSPARPQVRVYDIGADPLLAAVFYDNAVSDGAQFVVGPLGREAAEQVALNKKLHAPTLLLADLGDNLAVPQALYQFSLAPEQEAKQMAERAWLDGHRRAVLFHPDDSWGQRMREALETHWRNLGGIVLESQPFSATETDHSDVVKRAFNIDDSERRAVQMENIVKTRLDFEPRRRQDIDCIFLAARVSQARLVMPQINFHRGYRLPVYGTSQLYSGRADPVNDTDLDGINFGDMPWMLVPEGRIRHLRETLQGNWPGQRTAHDRLYAFGADSYSLVSRLATLATDPLARYSGLSGTLSMDRRGRLQRQLVWARFRSGTPVLLDSYYNPRDENADVQQGTGETAPAPETGPTGGATGLPVPPGQGPAPAVN